MIKSVLVTTFFLFGILFTGYAQEHFEPGYIVDQQGDTVKGFIDYRNWDRNPSKVGFRKALADQTATYEPKDIRGFGAANEKYVSATVSIDKSGGNNISKTADLELQTEPAFLLTLVYSPKSDKTLFQLKDSGGKDHFFVGQVTGPELLVFKNYYQFNPVSGTSSIGANKKFLGQLSLYLKDCADAQTYLKSVDYTQKSLSKLFHRYYSCTNTVAEASSPKAQITLEYGIVAGAMISSLSFSGEIPEKFTPGFDKSTNAYGGVFLDLVLPRAHKKWSIYNELSYSSYSTTTAPYTKMLTSVAKHVFVTELSFSYINFGSMLRLKYPVNKAYIFVNAGVSMGLNVSNTNSTRRDHYGLSGEFADTKYEEGIPARKAETGKLIGVGLRFDHYSFETRYAMTSGPSNLADTGSKVNRIMFLLSYRF